MAVLLFTWSSAAGQNLLPTRWLFGITKLDGLPNRTYAGRARQDRDFSATCCSRWHRRFSFPSMSIFHKCWEPFCVNRWNNQNPRRELGTIKVASIWLELSRENWLYAGFASGLQRQGWQRVGCLLWTWVVLWVIHLNPVGLRICCKIAKLAGSISKERAGLLSVKFLSMANDVFFRLPFAKVEEMETTGSVMLIWSLNFLSICYRLESPQIYYHIQTWSSEEISEGEQRCRDQSLNLWSSQTLATRSKKKLAWTQYQSKIQHKLNSDKKSMNQTVSNVKVESTLWHWHKQNSVQTDTIMDQTIPSN